MSIITTLARHTLPRSLRRRLGPMWASQVMRRRSNSAKSSAEKLRRKGTITDFHRLYYDAHLLGGTWFDTYWLGTRVQKCPLDLWIYQEMIVALKPELIVETGTAQGGSALFLATMCDAIGHGEVLTVDIVDEAQQVSHPRLQKLIGSSVQPAIIETVAGRVEATSGHVLVILDSDHAREHVARELELYAGFVTVGSYLVVEDTNLNGHPVDFSHGPGPAEAVDAFIRSDSRFVVDEGKEKFLLTFNPGGYLKRVR